MNNALKKILKIVLVVISVLLFFFSSVIISLYLLHIPMYNELKTLPEISANGDTFKIAGVNYTTNEPDSFSKGTYYHKEINNEDKYHVVTTENILSAIVKDFGVCASVDDPNNYVFITDRDLFGYQDYYYSENLKTPNIDNSEIRQLFITKSSGMVPDSDTPAITEPETINIVIEHIKSNKNPKSVIENTLNSVLSEEYAIVADYTDFPVYQLIYDATRSGDNFLIAS